MQGRARALDGLRGLAALAVVSAHATAELGAGPYASGGSVGVLVFFVLSGFLITGQVWHRGASPGRYGAFLRRRTVRLLPVILVLVVVGVPVVVFTEGSWRTALTGGLLTLTQTLGFVSATGVHPSPMWVVTWSLTVEWLFYLSAPLVVLWWLRRGTSPARASHLAASFAVGAYLVALPLPAAAFYHSPVANLGVMWAGAALALRLRARPVRQQDPAWTAFALVVLLLLVALPSDLAVGPYARVVALPGAVAASLVLIRGTTVPGSTPALLSGGPLPNIGLRAYSLYLWHLPVWWLVLLSTDLPPALTALVCIVPTLVVVELSYRFLEIPVLRPSRAPRRVNAPTSAVPSTGPRSSAAVRTHRSATPALLTASTQTAIPPAA